MSKKQELKEELAIARRAAATATRDADQLHNENEALRQQLTENVFAPPFRMVTDGAPTPVRVKIAQSLGIDPASTSAGITDEMILAAVERLRNPQLGSFADLHPTERPSMAMTKSDSLAEAIVHNQKERSDLSTGLAQARNIVNRLAGALNVPLWNADGDEIVEKAQRFGVFAYWLRKRLHAADAQVDAFTTSPLPVVPRADVEKAVADELRTILSALISDKELARILQNKPVKVSKTILDLAETPAPSGTTYLDHAFDPDDVMWIHQELKKVSTTRHPRVDQLFLVFERMAKSAAATEEFVSLMNAIVLPVLRKQHPAYQTMPREN